MNLKAKTVIVEMGSAFFIFLFIYASLSKVQEFEKFSIELQKSPVLSYFSGFISVAVPTSELIITGLLLIKNCQLVALYFSFSLMTMFTTYIVGILSFSSYIPCSCGGILQSMTWSQHLVFNLLIVLIAGAAILIYPVKIKDLSAVRGNAEPL